MELQYLDFEQSEDGDGRSTFDALASVPPAHRDALHAEAARLLAWAYRHFGEPAPLDEGGEWDYQLDGRRETPVAEQLCYDPASGRLASRDGAAGAPRHVLSLSVAGGPGFGEALRAELGLPG